jgi:hypothetical protein
MRAKWTTVEMTRRLPSDWRFSREDAALLVRATSLPSAPAHEPSQAARADRSADASGDEPAAPAFDLSTARTWPALDRFAVVGFAR